MGSGIEIDPRRELEILAAERAITRVILRYARGVDRLDFAMVRSCFHPDARIAYGDYFSGGLEEAMAWLEQSLPRLDGTLHDFGPPWIEFDDDLASACCETYSINAARYPPDEHGVVIQNVSGTRYLDRFALREGRWAITERRNLRAWSRNAPQGEDPPLPREGRTPARAPGARPR
jgi:hypothetical protein